MQVGKSYQEMPLRGTAAKPFGMHPVNWFSARYNRSSLSRLLSSDGICRTKFVI